MRLEQLVRARLPTGLIRERLLAEGILPTEKEFPRRMPEGRLFLEIKETLGHGSGEEQAAQFHLIAQELEGLYKGAREDARKNGRLFLLLGFFGGMLAGLAG